MNRQIPKKESKNQSSIQKKQNKTKQKTDYLNSPLSIKQIKFVVINFLRKKPTGPDGFTGELY